MSNWIRDTYPSVLDRVKELAEEAGMTLHGWPGSDFVSSGACATSGKDGCSGVIHAHLMKFAALIIRHDRAALAAHEAGPQQAAVWIQPDHLQKARVAPFLCRVSPLQMHPDFVPLYEAAPSYRPVSAAIREDRAALAAHEAGPDWRACLTAIMRAADSAKEPCGADHESSAAIRNGRLASIAAMAAEGLGLIRGPGFAHEAGQQEARPEIVGYMLYRDDIKHAALYPLSQRAEAFEAFKRWGNVRMTALVAHPAAPSPSVARKRKRQ